MSREHVFFFLLVSYGNYVFLTTIVTATTRRAGTGIAFGVDIVRTVTRMLAWVTLAWFSCEYIRNQHGRVYILVLNFQK